MRLFKPRHLLNLFNRFVIVIDIDIIFFICILIIFVFLQQLIAQILICMLLFDHICQLPIVKSNYINNWTNSPNSVLYFSSKPDPRI